MSFAAAFATRLRDYNAAGGAPRPQAAPSSSSSSMPAGLSPGRTHAVLQKLTFEAFTDSFTRARSMRRTVQVFTGPPNSGKSYEGFAELARAATGAYLAPLRLLALEGRDRLTELGRPCTLLTGEDYEPPVDEEGREVEGGGAHVSSTVEMVDTDRVVDCAVIDECQMLLDFTRGWAWTAAIVGVPAKKLVLVTAPHALEAVMRIVAACGEIARVTTFQRKGKLQTLSAPVGLAALQSGDAVVAFSRNDVLRMRDRIARGEAGKALTTAVVYGALPPEVRRREAERFASGEAQVLVASDAIGLGLNLPIARILFSTMRKFDGRMMRPLEVAEVHQIGGRAGRFGKKVGAGWVGVLEDAVEATAQDEVERSMARRAEPPPTFRAAVAPTAWHVRMIAKELGLASLTDILHLFFQHMRHDDHHGGEGSSSSGSGRGTGTAFVVVESWRLLELARLLDWHAPKLDVEARFKYACAPIHVSDERLKEEFLAWAGQHSSGSTVERPAFLGTVDAMRAEPFDHITGLPAAAAAPAAHPPPRTAPVVARDMYGNVHIMDVEDGGADSEGAADPAAAAAAVRESSLNHLEYAMRASGLYLFLEAKFGPEVFPHVEEVLAGRADLVDRVSNILSGEDTLAPPGAQDKLDKKAAKAAAAAAAAEAAGEEERQSGDIGGGSERRGSRGAGAWAAAGGRWKR